MEEKDPIISQPDEAKTPDEAPQHQETTQEELKKFEKKLGEKRFPNWADYLVFLGIFLVAQLFGMLVAWVAGIKWPDPLLLASPDDAVRTAEQIVMGHFNALSYAVTMVLTLVGLLAYRRWRHGPTIIAHFSSRGWNPILLLWGVVLMIAASVVLEPLMNLMPQVPNVYGRGVWAMLTLVVMAPVFEELIFRGVLLESTRLRYGVVAAWLLSSLLFAIVHVHPAIVVNAFVMGLILAFVYIRANSLWASIVLHAVNNGIAFLMLISGHGNTLLIDVVGNRTVYVLIYIAAVAIFVISGYQVIRTLHRLKERDKNQAEA